MNNLADITVPTPGLPFASIFSHWPALVVAGALALLGLTLWKTSIGKVLITAAVTVIIVLLAVKK